MSLDTVYRTLSMLEEAGVVRRVSTQSPSIRYDANVDPHHHFVCTDCGRVRDFACDRFDSLNPPRSLASWGTIQNVQVQVQGVCADCRPPRRGRAKPKRKKEP